MTDDELLHRALDWRGVDDPCQRCGGSGTRTYDSTATWRGGMVGATLMLDVCDACWGTGDRYRTGVGLRRLRDEGRERVAKAAVTTVVDSCLAQPGQGYTGELLLELDKLLDRRRMPMSIFAQSALCGLRTTRARHRRAGEATVRYRRRGHGSGPTPLLAHRAVEVSTRALPDTGRGGQIRGLDKVAEAFRQTEESWRETWREEIESGSRKP